MPTKVIKLGDANVEQKSLLTRQVTVGIEVALSSILGLLASNRQEEICRHKSELDLSSL